MADDTATRQELGIEIGNRFEGDSALQAQISEMVWRGRVPWSSSSPLGVPGNGSVPGPAGPQGPQGTDGAQGPVGPQGPQGNDGAQGPQGPAGADGAGAQIMGEVSEPSELPNPGIAGEGYLIDGILWLWDNGQQAWYSTGATLRGPQGPQGMQGAQGPIGPQGPKGDDGAQGPAGYLALAGTYVQYNGDAPAGTAQIEQLPADLAGMGKTMNDVVMVELANSSSSNLSVPFSWGSVGTNGYNIDSATGRANFASNSIQMASNNLYMAGNAILRAWASQNNNNDNFRFKVLESPQNVEVYTGSVIELGAWAACYNPALPRTFGAAIFFPRTNTLVFSGSNSGNTLVAYIPISNMHFNYGSGSRQWSNNSLRINVYVK